MYCPICNRETDLTCENACSNFALIDALVDLEDADILEELEDEDELPDNEL